MNKKRIGIFIDHDLLIRHFLVKNKFKMLEKKFDVKYFFSNNKRRISVNLNQFKINRKATVKIDLVRRNKINKLSLVARLVMANKKKNKSFRKASLKETYGYINSRTTIIIYTFFALKIIYPFFNWFIRKFFIKYNFYLENIVKKNKLDIIIHPTVLNGDFASDLIEIGNKNNIPTLYLMNSWDNCSSRALTHGQPTKYLVWGKQAKKFAKESLNLKEKNLGIIGCAQFEIYKEKALISKKQFRKMYKVKKNEKFFCYAGSNIGIDETKHLKILDDEIEKNTTKFKVLYRPHPWKLRHPNEKSFFEYNFKNIFLEKYSLERYKQSFFKLKKKQKSITEVDYRHTNTIIKSIDGALIPFSTFAIECSLNGVPVGLYYPTSKNEYSDKFQLETDFFQFLIKILKPKICFGEKNIYKTFLYLKEKSNIFSFKKNIKTRVKQLVDIEKKNSYSEDLLFFCNKFLKI